MVCIKTTFTPNGQIGGFLVEKRTRKIAKSEPSPLTFLPENKENFHEKQWPVDTKLKLNLKEMEMESHYPKPAKRQKCTFIK